MLIFFIHGVGVTDSNYARDLISNIRDEMNKYNLYFYTGFWGNLFNNKKEKLISSIKADLSKTIEHNSFIWSGLRQDIFRYRDRRYYIINNFIGDFIIYQNIEKGKAIRESIVNQFAQFIKSHPEEKQVHFVSHSLGCLILWDLLFSCAFENNDPAHQFRNILSGLSLQSITTMGSPLLFINELLDVNVNLAINSKECTQLRWLNLIHSSDLIAYPMSSIIGEKTNVKFWDQYIWQDGNTREQAVRSANSDLAMVIGAEDAHSSYLNNLRDGRITAKLIAYNLVEEKNIELDKRSVWQQ